MKTLIFATPSDRYLLAGLQDLSAMGLLQPFAWCEVDPTQLGGNTTDEAFSCSNGVIKCRPIVELGNELTDDACVLTLEVIHADEEHRSIAGQASEIMRRAAPASHVRRVRFVIPWDGVCGGQMSRQLGWLTLVLSPEISRAPKEVPQLWNDREDERSLTTMAAIAGITSLWNNAPSALDWGALDQTMVYVVKSYIYGVDSRNVRDMLQSTVLQVSDPYETLLTETGADVPLVPDSARAAGAMAKQWFQKNQKNIAERNYPQPPAGSQAARIGALEAIKMFFAFIFNSLRTAPRRWFERKYREVCARIAGSVQSTVYGSANEYRVIVGGVDADGTPASWDTLRQTAEQFVPEGFGGDENGLAQQGAHTFDQPVSDYVEAALMLVDAHQSQRLECLKVNGQPAMVSTPQAVMPRIEHWTHRLANEKIQATDDLVITQELARLEALKHNPVERRQFEELKAWSQLVCNNFNGYVFRGITGQINQARTRLHDAKEQLAFNEEEQRRLNAGGEDSADRPLFWAKIANISLVLLLIATGFVHWFAQLDGVITAVIVGAVILGWLIAQIFSFRLYSGATAERLRRAEEIESNLDYYQDIADTACHHIARYCALALTLEQWAPIVSRFIHEPFGAGDEHERDVQVPETLGSLTRIPKSELPQTGHEDIAYELRTQWLRQTWATNLWSRLVESFPKRLSSPNQRHRAGTHNLAWYYGLAHTDKVLRSLSRAIRTDGIGRFLADKLGPEIIDGHRDIQEVVGDQQKQEFIETCWRQDTSEALASLFTTEARAGRRNAMQRATYKSFELAPGISVAQAIYRTGAALSDDDFADGQQKHAAASPATTPHLDIADNFKFEEGF